MSEQLSESIWVLLRRIRDHINRPKKYNIKIQENWDKVCASIHVIEDTQYAIEYYNSPAYPENHKGRYLFLYGLMQALFVQQDAVKHINSALGYPDIDFKKNKDYKRLYE